MVSCLQSDRGRMARDDVVCGAGTVILLRSNPNRVS
jgi:hypothetical protein